MNQTDCEFRPQQQFGQPLGPGDYLIFQAQVLKPETVVRYILAKTKKMMLKFLRTQTFLVDFYAHNSSQNGDPPEHMGFCYVLQNNMTQSQGAATVPITSPKHLPIGQLKGTIAGLRLFPVVKIRLKLQWTT